MGQSSVYVHGAMDVCNATLNLAWCCAFCINSASLALGVIAKKLCYVFVCF